MNREVILSQRYIANVLGLKLCGKMMYISKYAEFLLLIPIALFPFAGRNSMYAQKSVSVLNTSGNVSETTLSQDEWTKLIQTDLAQEKFDDLDHMADRYRQEKLRVPGGEWRLQLFYSALAAPYKTDEQVQEYIAHAERWVQQQPQSITARVALAIGYRKWSLAIHFVPGSIISAPTYEISDRLNKAKAILEESAHMQPLCPQLYLVLMSLYTDSGHITNAFQRGIKVEPDYFYLHREYAWDLWHSERPGDLAANGPDTPSSSTDFPAPAEAPLWSGVPALGHPEVAAAFAKASADHMGGDAGDLLYFQIAAHLIRRDGKDNGDFPITKLDWPRIQRGYKVLSTQYGITQWDKNELALMAYKFQDSNIARQQLTLIGDHWLHSVWGDQKYYDRVRKWCGIQAS